MDIHKPKPIHSLGDFFSELGTIVLGIVIALALEAAVEAHHNASLVEHARADFREELRRNRDKIAADLQQDKGAREVLEQLIGFAQARAHHVNTQFQLTHTISRAFVHLPESAWRTALSTQVMVHFPHEEARRISEAYAEQEVFSAVEQTAQQTWFELGAFDLSDAGLSEVEAQAALKQLRISYAYLLSLQAGEQRLLQAYDAELSLQR